MSIPTFSTKQFSYIPMTAPVTGHFSAEASSLRGEFLPGFVMRSHRSGAEVLFRFVNKHWDDEGDLTHWEFQGLHSGMIFTAHVWND